LAAGVATGDRALWVGPHIYRASAGSGTPIPSATVTNTPSTPLPSQTPTSTGAPSATPTATATGAATTYQNTKYGFKFTLPTGATIVNQSDNAGRVNLPFTAGTNL